MKWYSDTKKRNPMNVLGRLPVTTSLLAVHNKQRWQKESLTDVQ